MALPWAAIAAVSGLELLEPPYSVYVSAALRPGGLSTPTGLILAVELGRGALSGRSAGHSLARLAALAPTVPRVARVSPDTDPRHIAQAFYGGRLHAHALIVDGEHPGDALRPLLTSIERLRPTAAEWLQCRLPTLPHELRAAIARRIGTDGAPREWSAACSSATEASWRRQLGRCGAPPPVQWRTLSRALHAALIIQSDATRRIADVAWTLGFQEQSSLTATIVRCFDLRPTDLRGTLGVAWLMDRWAAAHRIIAADVFRIDLERVIQSKGVRATTTQH